MRHPVTLCLTLLAGCGVQADHSGPAGQECRIDLEGWNRGDIETPNRVTVWRVDVGENGFVINGRPYSDPEGYREIFSTKSYRPSPYLIIDRERGVSCDRLNIVLRNFQQGFSCSTNYCYFRSE